MYKKKEKIFVAGHQGMVGKAIMRELELSLDFDIVTADKSALNLLNQSEVNQFFNKHKFDQVYLAAAKVGGIHANNTYPADFIYQNLMIQSNVINAAYMSEVNKLLFLGSSCIYPKMALQPMKETTLLSGHLEPTNEAYAIAKIAGIKMCESYNRQYGVDYRSIMPTNLYGENDNFHLENSHVIPALIRRFHEAKFSDQQDVVVWGSGKAMREFLYVEDMAKAAIFIMNLNALKYNQFTRPNRSHVNVGTGVDCTIQELSKTIARVIGFNGNIIFDISKPDGAPRKLLDVSLINSLGWKAEFSLEAGLMNTYNWFLANQSEFRK